MATEVQPYPGIQRPLRGSRISTFYPVKSLPALSSLDSAFQLQEYISLLIRLDVHDVETITSLPGLNKDVRKEEKDVDKDGFSISISADSEKSGDEKDINVDEACWIYEQLRRLAQDLTHPLITTLQQECSRTTCPEMKAGEWLYLCVAHGAEGAMEQCCAIDYILHTLDSATALLNSPRAFPSRLQIPTASHRHFSSLARRLGRIFAHAYFHHREAFEQAEAESSLYARFLALTSKFDLVPSEFLVIPAGSHISGNDSDEEEGGDEGSGTSGSGFGLREVKLGTSYDPRRGQGMGGQHQLPSSFQDEFPDIPRARRLPQQYQQYHQSSPLQLHHSGHYQPQHPHQESPMSGTESPKKTGRNRTHTMVLSEAAGVADDLAKAAAAARAEEERDKERMRKESEERDARAREEAEREEREKAEAAAQARAKRNAEEFGEQDVSEEKEQEAEAESVGSQPQMEEIKLAEENAPVAIEETTATAGSEATNRAHEPSSTQTEVDIAEGVSSTVTATTENHTSNLDTSIKDEVEEISTGGSEIETEALTEGAKEDGEGQSGSEVENVSTKDDGVVPENETQSESGITEKSEPST